MRTMHLVAFSERRRGMVRLLTLLCFFHFSGLNNGFTFLRVSPGHVENMSFAPALIERMAGMMNPMSWVRAAGDGRWMDVFARQTRVIEIASQNAVGNILTETALFRAWFNCSVASAVAGEASPGSVKAEESLPGHAVDLSMSGGRFLSFAGETAVLNQEGSDSWIRIEKMDLNSAGQMKSSRHPDLWARSLMRVPDRNGGGEYGGDAEPFARRAGSHYKALMLGAGGRKLGGADAAVVWAGTRLS